MYNESSSDLGFCDIYELPEGIEKETNESQTYLAGSYNFKVKEIEVYKLEWILIFKWEPF